MKKLKSLKFFSLALVMLFSLSFLPGQLIKADELIPIPSKEVVLDYYSLNDFHGSVEGPKDIAKDKNPGLSKIQTYMKNQKAVNPNSFLLSAGDHYQGSAISNLTKGKVITEIFKEMGLLASAVGNHEFDFGTKEISGWAKDGGYTFLASNIEVEAGKKPASWDEYVKPYMIQEVVVDGKTIKVGFIGIATPETAYKTAAENVVGFTFTDPIVATKKYSKILKDLGADAVLSLTHLGGFQKDGVVSGEVVEYANALKGVVDGIFLGHTHQLIQGVVNGIPVVQGQYNGRSISQLSLNFTVDGDKVALSKTTGTVTNLTKLIPTLADDPNVSAIVKKYKDELGPILDEVLGDLQVDLHHDTNISQVTPMGEFVAKAMAEVGKTQIGIINGGGVRRGFEKGLVTMGLMYELLPFDNSLVTLKVTGAELKKLIEHGLYPKDFKAGQFYGLKIVETKNAAPGSRISEMRLLDGTLIKDTEVYSVATLDFINDGGDKYNFKNATDVVETFIPVRDMIVDYIKDKKVINDVFSNPVDVQYNLDYYSINDFHGNVEMGGKNPGLAKIQTFMKQRRAMNKDSFFVSAGDHFQGTAISNLTEGKVVNEILKEMGLLTSAIGNHEFDFGTDKIPVWAKDGGYLFLASNIEVEESKKPAEWDKYVKPYMIQEVVIEGQTVKIGFIGIATPETAFKTAAENVVGFKFTDPIEATNKYSKILKAQGVDAVIALTHLGGFQKDGKISGEILDYAKGIEGVNAIFLGHTHQLVDGVVNGIPVVQGQYNGRSLSNISLNFSLSGEKVKFNGAKAKVINMTALIETLEDDPAVKAIITKYKNELGPILDKVIGTLKNDLPHDTNTMQVSPMGQFVTKILAEAGGTQIAIMNGGGIRIGFEKGPITMGLMYELLPFDNTLVTLKLSGAELKKIVEHGLYPEEFRPGQFYGLKVWHDKNLKKGQRITSMRLLDGTLIEDSKIYTVSTLDFLITGGDKYDFSKATNVVDSNIPVRDLIADYIEKKQEITYTYVDSLVQGKDTTVVDKKPVDKDKEKLPAAGAAGETIYYSLGMLSLLSAGVIVGKRKRKEA